MRDIKLKKLTLTDFRAQTRTVGFNDTATHISGTNGIGKSTLFDAFLWLLLGVDSLDRANYDLFDNKREFTPENAIPAIVEGVFDVDGAEYALRRQAKQKWVRERGSAEYSKAKSDEYKFFVDGLELSATAYKDKVVDLFGADIDTLKMILNVRYYQSLNWKDLRKFFSDLVGEINDSDLKGDYSAVMPYIEKHKGSDNAKEYVRQQIKPLENQIKEIDADIKATQRQLPDLAPVDEAESKIAGAKKRIDEINKEILGLEEANKPFVEKRNAQLDEITALKREYSEKESDYALIQSRALALIEDELAKAKKHNAEIENSIKRNEQIKANRQSEIKLCREDIEDLEGEIARLRKQNTEIKSRVFSDTVCAHCGQELPADMIAELRTKFYERNDIERAPIVERGKKLSARLESQKERLAKLESSEIVLSDNADVKPIDCGEITARLEKAKASYVPFSDTDEAKDLTAKIEDMTANLTEVPEVNSTELRGESKRLVDEVQELSQITARRDRYNDGIKSIEQLESDKKDVGVELAKWEGLLNTLMMRERERADIMRERANEHLNYVKVQMLDRDKAGNLFDCCNVTYDGVDVNVANTAAKVEAGIDISSAFMAKANACLPLIIDNAEQVVDVKDMRCSRQIITLSVDGDYTELTILS